MNVDQLKKVINDYISTQNTTYGVMINGPWGIGKTYFINELLKKDLLYVSLYGVKSIEGIDDRIFSGLIGLEEASGAAIDKVGKLFGGVLSAFDKEGSSSIGAAITSTLGSALKRKALENISAQKILVFDDFERAALSQDEILSKINEFTEHRNNKVIVICDETKINSELSAYWDNKEKTILFTNTLRRSSEELAKIAFSNVLCEKGKENLLKASIEELARILEEIEACNLRILGFAISCYEKLIHRIDEINHTLKNDNEKLVLLIFPCVGYALAQRQYKVQQDMLEQCATDYNTFLTCYHLKMGRDGNISAEKETDEWEKWDKFYKEVVAETYPFQFKSVFSYISHGLLDDKLIVDDLKQFEPEKLSEISIITGHQMALDSLYSSAVSSVINKMADNTLIVKSANELANLVTSLLYQFEMQAFSYDSEEALISVLESYLDYALAFLDLDPSLNAPYFGYDVPEGKAKELIEKIINTSKRIEKNSSRLKLQLNIQKAIKNSDQREAYTFANRSRLEPYLDEKTSLEVIKLLKEAPLDHVLNFSRFITGRYESSNIFDFLSEEVPALKVLLSGADEYRGTQEASASKYSFNVLSRKLKAIVSRYNELYPVIEGDDCGFDEKIG